MNNPLDYLGKPINVGDHILWAAQRGDSPCLCQGVVTQIKGDESLVSKIQVRRKANSQWEQDGRLVTLHSPSRIVVMPKVAPEFPLDFLLPSPDEVHKPYFIPHNGRIPDKAGEVTNEDSGQS